MSAALIVETEARGERKVKRVGRGALADAAADRGSPPRG